MENACSIIVSLLRIRFILCFCYVPARRIRLKIEYRFYVTKLSLMENGSLQAVVRILM